MSTFMKRQPGKLHTSLISHHTPGLRRSFGTELQFRDQGHCIAFEFCIGHLGCIASHPLSLPLPQPFLQHPDAKGVNLCSLTSAHWRHSALRQLSCHFTGGLQKCVLAFPLASMQVWGSWHLIKLKSKHRESKNNDIYWEWAGSLVMSKKPVRSKRLKQRGNV